MKIEAKNSGLKSIAAILSLLLLLGAPSTLSAAEAFANTSIQPAAPEKPAQAPGQEPSIDAPEIHDVPLEKPPVDPDSLKVPPVSQAETPESVETFEPETLIPVQEVREEKKEQQKGASASAQVTVTAKPASDSSAADSSKDSSFTDGPLSKVDPSEIAPQLQEIKSKAQPILLYRVRAILDQDGGYQMVQFMAAGLSKREDRNKLEIILRIKAPEGTVKVSANVATSCLGNKCMVKLLQHIAALTKDTTYDLVIVKDTSSPNPMIKKPGQVLLARSHGRLVAGAGSKGKAPGEGGTGGKPGEGGAGGTEKPGENQKPPVPGEHSGREVHVGPVFTGVKFQATGLRKDDIIRFTYQLGGRDMTLEDRAGSVCSGELCFIPCSAPPGTPYRLVVEGAPTADPNAIGIALLVVLFNGKGEILGSQMTNGNISNPGPPASVGSSSSGIGAIKPGIYRPLSGYLSLDTRGSASASISSPTKKKKRKVAV